MAEEYTEKKVSYHRKGVLAKYGITNDHYAAMYEYQEGCCALCGKRETSAIGGKTRQLAVDHDHQTGAVRGLLCTRCNMGMGYFGDSIELLEQAIAYLKANLSHSEIVKSS